MTLDKRLVRERHLAQGPFSHAFTASGSTDRTAVMFLSVMLAGSPILHCESGPFEARPINPFIAGDQYVQSRERFSVIVSPSVFSAYPKNTPRCAVVTTTGRPDGVEQLCEPSSFCPHSEQNFPAMIVFLRVMGLRFGFVDFFSSFFMRE